MPERPRKRPYWRIERERRFVLDALPAHIDPDAFERLVDVYVVGTQLRLRRVEAPDGTLIVAKLGQKRPTEDSSDDPRHRQMTTFYLRTEDLSVLEASLAGHRSVKRRYKVAEQGAVFCVDVWEEPASARGVILSEVECDTDEALDAIVAPTWARVEVTEDERYSGFALASGATDAANLVS